MRGVAVHQNEAGQWVLAIEQDVVAGPYATNREAWRALDRLADEPISRAETVSDWIARQALDGAT